MEGGTASKKKSTLQEVSYIAVMAEGWGNHRAAVPHDAMVVIACLLLGADIPDLDAEDVEFGAFIGKGLVSESQR